MRMMTEKHYAAWDAYRNACDLRSAAWFEYEKMHKRTEAAQKREDAAWEVYKEACAKVEEANATYNAAVAEVPA